MGSDTLRQRLELGVADLAGVGGIGTKIVDGDVDDLEVGGGWIGGQTKDAHPPRVSVLIRMAAGSIIGPLSC
jgi:hypothetical protein